MNCTYAPQGRNYEEYKSYLRSLGSTPKVQLSNVRANVEIATKLFSTAKEKSGKDPKRSSFPDEAYLFAMKSANFLEALMKTPEKELVMCGITRDQVRSMMRFCIGIAEDVSNCDGSLRGLHDYMLTRERSGDSMRDELISKQYEKGELAEDERKMIEIDGGLKQREHEQNRLNTVSIRSVLDEDKMSKYAQLLAAGPTLTFSPGNNINLIESALYKDAIKQPLQLGPFESQATKKSVAIPIQVQNSRPEPVSLPSTQPLKCDEDFLTFPKQTLTPQWKYSSSSIPEKVGLRNLGNTCFMNSILQCLFSIRDFRIHLTNQDYLRDLVLGGNKGRVINSLSEVFSNMSQKSGTVNPSNLKSVVGDRNETFSGYSQQDAYEFFLSLLNEVNCDVNSCNWMLGDSIQKNCSNNDFSIAMDSARDYFKRNSLNSIIPRLFMLQTKSVTKCLNCANVSRVFNTEFGLELPFPTSSHNKDIVDINSLLEEYCKIDRFDETSGFKCEKCKKYVAARRQTTLFSLPRVLTITLKRFKNNGNFSDKISCCVSFPETLSLKPYCFASIDTARNSSILTPAADQIIHKLLTSHASESTQSSPEWTPSGVSKGPLYRLIGIVNHRGNIHGGHYTADVRDDNETSWARVSDDSVTQADKPDRALAYMLFYELLP